MSAITGAASCASSSMSTSKSRCSLGRESWYSFRYPASVITESPHVLSFMERHSFVARDATSRAGVQTSPPRRRASSSRRAFTALESYARSRSREGGACVSATSGSGEIKNASSVRIARMLRSSFWFKPVALCTWCARRAPRWNLSLKRKPNFRYAKPWNESAFVFAGNLAFASSITARLNVRYANRAPGRRRTYSSNVVVLPVPANARTSITWSSRTSEVTTASCSCVSSRRPLALPGAPFARASSMAPVASSTCASRASRAASTWRGCERIPPPSRHDALDIAATSRLANSSRSRRGQNSATTPASAAPAAHRFAARSAASNRKRIVVASSAAVNAASASNAQPSFATPLTRDANGRAVPERAEDARNRTTPAVSTTPRRRNHAACASRRASSAGFSGTDADVVSSSSFTFTSSCFIEDAAVVPWYAQPRRCAAIFAKRRNASSSTASRQLALTARASPSAPAGRFARIFCFSGTGSSSARQRFSAWPRPRSAAAANAPKMEP